MRTALYLAFALIAGLQLSAASAQVYQWKDSSGRTIISDTPPPANTKGSRAVATSPAPAAAAEGAASAPKTTAEKDMEFKKRQQEARQKAEKDAKEQAAAADRKDNCERARQHLAAMESGERLVTRDEKGERHFLDDGQRQQEMERARKIITESCK
ncbi:MAG: hypothetical protein H6R10_542 [Rhodocyclaceae bacterium]|nr:hypothetical protein [Rhodocyclaceae bacterium]